MRRSDVLLLPSLEEGSALVCGEAMGAGCALLVSDASSGICRNNENALIHTAGDVETLARHISLLNDDRDELARLRRGALATAPEVTWSKAGAVLVDAYRRAVAGYAGKHASEPAGIETSAAACDTVRST
jgi:glycosyltransferase involved in cell wall biosynthesis